MYSSYNAFNVYMPVPLDFSTNLVLSQKETTLQHCFSLLYNYIKLKTMEILTFPNCRQSIWLAVFFILWTVIVQVICIISGVPSYLCATILYVSTVTILAIAFEPKQWTAPYSVLTNQI